MTTLILFQDFVKEITSSNSRKFKQEVLEKWKNNQGIKEYLKILFDPYKVYGISSKKLHKQITGCQGQYMDDIFSLFEYLEEHNTGRDEDIKTAQAMVIEAGRRDPELAALLEKLICKDLPLGIEAKSINAVMGPIIPRFEVMLANKYFDNPKKLEGKQFAITTKLDGFRLVAMKDEAGNVSFFSRVGQRIEGLIEIEEELKNAFPEGTVLDGELTISNYFEMASKEAYKAASKIIRLKGDTPKTGLTYRVFDGMHIDEWRSQNCTHSYSLRRNLLHGLFKFPMATISHIELLPVLYQGDDVSKVTEILEQIVAAGGEGCMINLLDSPYRFNRCWDIMKVKKMNTLDLEVVGYEEGSGRLEGTLGALLVRYKDGNIVKVGSGFSDELRALIWLEPSDFIGKIVEVQYFEETSNADGGKSLRFPVFKDFRTDKTEADF